MGRSWEVMLVLNTTGPMSFGSDPNFVPMLEASKCRSVLIAAKKKAVWVVSNPRHVGRPENGLYGYFFTLQISTPVI